MVLWKSLTICRQIWWGFLVWRTRQRRNENIFETNLRTLSLVKESPVTDEQLSQSLTNKCNNKKFHFRNSCFDFSFPNFFLSWSHVRQRLELAKWIRDKWLYKGLHHTENLNPTMYIVGHCTLSGAEFKLSNVQSAMANTQNTGNNAVLDGCSTEGGTDGQSSAMCLYQPPTGAVLTAYSFLVCYFLHTSVQCGL